MVKEPRANKHRPLTEDSPAVSRVANDVAQYFVDLALVHKVLVEFVVLGAGRRKGARLRAGPRLAAVGRGRSRVGLRGPVERRSFIADTFCQDLSTDLRDSWTTSDQPARAVRLLFRAEVVLVEHAHPRLGLVVENVAVELVVDAETGRVDAV